MKIDLRATQTYQAFILGGLGIFLLAKIGDGRILLYINQRFVFLILLAALVFLLLAQVLLRSRPPAASPEEEHHAEHPASHEHSHKAYGSWGLWLLALPVLVGLLVPQRPLGASAASLRGISSTSPLSTNGADGLRSLAVPLRERTVLDWMRAFAAAPDTAQLVGQAVDVTGFVYHDPRQDELHFYVARFSVTCCVADAAAVGLEVNWTQGPPPQDNTWVRVQGKLAEKKENGQPMPFIQATQVTLVPAPEQPYLFQ